MATNVVAVTADIPITIKIAIDGTNRKFKLPLKELTDPDFLKSKLRFILQVPDDHTLVLERFSDSSASYIPLTSNNPSAHKQLYRAAKAKLKLRFKATVVIPESEVAVPAAVPEVAILVAQESTPRPSITVDAVSLIKTETVAQADDVSRNISTQSGRDAFFAQLASISRERDSFRRQQAATLPGPSTWQVFCNSCDKPMNDIHYHCSICDDGDYDLCDGCVATGKVCPGESHWLIKRGFKNGIIVNSTTQTVQRKQEDAVVKKAPLVETRTAVEEQPNGERREDMPGTFHAESKPMASIAEPMRTCNACVFVLPEHKIVTCNECKDYDLCVPCHVQNDHGHHPAHSFKPVSEETIMSAHAKSLCSSGRNLRHAAVCDGCEKSIFGVRHKCLTCPDWDYCLTCIQSARSTHRGHRFVPIYEPLGITSFPKTRHFGVYCDGPLCRNTEKTYITGVRYKCSICHDIDFCANCEAHPSNSHNQTHPLIKFKTAVRNVSITTFGENQGGAALPSMGDRQPVRARPDSSSGQSQMRSASATSPPPYTPQVSAPTCGLAQTAQASCRPNLEAHFVRDTIADGQYFVPAAIFVQSWTLCNPGPLAWPVGCCVHHTGGDSMFDKHMAEGQHTNATDRQVLPGESFNFNISLTAPARKGKCISYWRLKSPEGMPFGHKMWCDINVINDAFPRPGATLADYQRQLMLLEHQNERRLREVRAVLGDPGAFLGDPVARLSKSNVTSGILSQLQDLNLQSGPIFGARKKLTLGARAREVQPAHANQASKEVALGSPAAEANARAEVLASNHAMQIANILNSTSPIAVKTASEAPPSAPIAVCSSEAIRSTTVGAPELDVKKQVSSESSSTMAGSQMIFPTLEKESPVSSMHVDSAPSTVAAVPETPKPVDETSTETTKSGAIDNFEDLDSLDLGESDDEFLTDEEYDILDASDDDIINGPKA